MFGKNNSEIERAVILVKAMAAGDFEKRITDIKATGATEELLYAINDLVDRCDAYVRETAACMEAVSDNKYYREILEKGMGGSFGTASRTVNVALGHMRKRVEGFSNVTNEFENNIGAVVNTVSSAAEQLSTSSKSMQDVANNATQQTTTIAAASEEASTNVQTVASASEQLNASITEISGQVAAASSTVQNAAAVSETVAGKVIELQEAASQIVKAIDIINDIADQTNLLALNATIEAARAGEAGKGFAVVASEVKTLASQTSKATDEIRGYVNSIQIATDSTVAGISDIAKNVGQVNEANTSISSAVEQQSAATNEIARNIEQASAGTAEVATNISGLSAASQQTGSTAHEVNDAASELAIQSASLQNLVDSYVSNVRQIM